MTSTETLIRALADRAELADLVARHSLWVDEGRYGEARGIGALIELVRSGHDTYGVHSRVQRLFAAWPRYPLDWQLGASLVASTRGCAAFF
jgi:hypothetical protein